ncbi:MAG: 16S rRNA (guanine(527)-N(7))-methyltransferase RsmG [Myxococcaceae bacterium]
MDNSLLAQGLQKLSLTLSPEQQADLLAWADELLKWNPKVSLTAITRPDEVVDKHLLDSLAVLPEVQGVQHLLDLGAGAGLPGIPLAVALPSLQVTLVDAVAKKVGFMKSAAVKARVANRVKALHCRAEGQPAKEGLPVVDCVTSRAFMDVGPFLQLARHYLQPGGKVVCMVGQTPPAEVLEAAGRSAGLSLASRRTFTLPLSGDPRGVVVFHVEQPKR